ncbi:hypothetical protein QR680_007979 [Steinernema hermaphroditum]|uniref:Uncharacterized protein n=1 Tax=Steinernema hermaphroditum TaxID=289476 RepID=A0AA39IHC1_9BILA|nr:hypothetical protein QR680_007979 [Steinernema hermaphroditum]
MVFLYGLNPSSCSTMVGAKCIIPMNPLIFATTVSDFDAGTNTDMVKMDTKGTIAIVNGINVHITFSAITIPHFLKETQEQINGQAMRCEELFKGQSGRRMDARIRKNKFGNENEITIHPVRHYRPAGVLQVDL